MNFPTSSAGVQYEEQTPYGDDSRGRRDSNALRASVLDVAMQLGIGSSRTLQNWIFDAVDEEDEGDIDDDEVRSGECVFNGLRSDDPSVGALRPASSTRTFQIHLQRGF